MDYQYDLEEVALYPLPGHGFGCTLTQNRNLGDLCQSGAQRVCR
jgi:hypothetical protein